MREEGGSSGGVCWGSQRKSRFLIPFKRRTGFGMTGLSIVRESPAPEALELELDA